MKVAFISRATLYTVPGGDTTQIVETAENLKKLGVDVTIHLSTDQVNYSQYDLLHFFNITRPADIMQHAVKAGKPFVVSPIYVVHGNINEQNKGLLFRTLTRFFSADGLSYIKSIARWIKNGEKIVSKKYLLLGQAKSVKWIARNAKCLLPNSESEMRRFIKAYGINTPYHVVPNGIDTSMLEKNIRPSAEYKDAIICLARFEPLKNQLNLIKALNDTPYRVYLHGKPSPNNVEYYERCKNEAAYNIQFRSWLKGDELYRVYGSARVHVLPSYFETTGLASLEAAVMGCNVVVTDKGDTRDYFKDDAWYCNPDDPESIKQAVDAAFNAPYNENFKKRILAEYTWEHAAKETFKAYSDVLKL